MTSHDPKQSFALAKIFVWTAIASVPIALFGQYYYWANNTVDASTQPLLESGAGLLYFVALVGVIVILCLIPLRQLLLTRRYRAATAFVAVLGVCLVLAHPIIDARILHPPRGNSNAQLHNDAAAIAAASVLKYFDRTHKWPSTWSDLQPDVEGVIGEIQNYQNQMAALRPASGPPPSSLKPFESSGASIAPTAATAAAKVSFAQSTPMSEPAQSVLERPVDLSSVDFQKLQRLVDIDFEAEPIQLIRQPWHQFSGIRPHKPSYNMYRVEYQMLLNRMSRWAESEGYLNTPTRPIRD